MRVGGGGSGLSPTSVGSALSRGRERPRRRRVTGGRSLPAVREALNQEAEEDAPDGRMTAFSGGAVERFRGLRGGWLTTR